MKRRSSVAAAAALLAAASVSGCRGRAPAAPVEQAAPPPVADEPAPAPAPAPQMTGTFPGDLVPQFQADVRRREGASVREEAFDSRATKRPTLYVVNSASCPSCRDYAARLRAIEEEFVRQGVDVVHLYANRGETAAEKLASHEERGFVGGFVLDADAAIARRLEADRTPTVYVVDAKGVVFYRGAVDDSPSDAAAATPYLSRALRALLDGRPADPALTEPEG